MQVYQAEFAGRAIRYAFHYPDTARHFRSWIRPVGGEDYDVSAPPELIAEAHRRQPEQRGMDYAEYKALISMTSEFLLPDNCCVFHAVAFLWRGRAWLLTAPSGTGKSTQFMNWRRQHPGEIMMICGDMPILERRADGSVWVHPTSWTGKENVGSFTAAPLGGVVLLEQGKENRIRPLSASEAILPLLAQFVVDPETEESVRALCGLLDALLRAGPVWKLVNLGDAPSTELLRETIAQRTGDEHGTI